MCCLSDCENIAISSTNVINDRQPVPILELVILSRDGEKIAPVTYMYTPTDSTFTVQVTRTYVHDNVIIQLLYHN